MLRAAYLSLGSNVGDREANLRTAIEKLGAFGEVRKISSLYETEPVEFTKQPWFLNCVVELETETMPRQLLGGILGIEQQMGRKRVRPKGPRLIDLDILLFASAVMDSAGLTIPHPAMHERGFVLVPLAEIAPQVKHPVLKKSVGELLQELPQGSPVVRKFVEK